MDGKMRAAATHENTFEPTSDLIQEEECDTLLIYLPGFTKEQLRVQLAKSGTLKISGKRPEGVSNNKWSSFEKDFPVSSNCDTTKITAKFEGGILYIRQPKLIVPADENKLEDKKTPPPHQAAPPPQEQPATPKTDDHNNKQKSVDDITQKKEGKSVEEKSSSDHGSMHDHDDRTAAEKSGNINDKRDNISRDDEVVNKGSNIRDSVAKVDDDKQINAAAKLKMSRQMMNIVMVVLFAIAIGMYSTKLISFFKRGDQN
ncbi:hypothetical protein BUALT_Bualt02G0170700 [Buddleja alternifolia]|uniref:SHSP domain-containing protein n=1 Tax=Buddleja alternifolia TaxID=168488 RepID=A0AAV6YBZ2_9LAMI|nr:hypothetical protein BUALT_Bualt02G0170700 [Buddleja alternifolia]